MSIKTGVLTRQINGACLSLHWETTRGETVKRKGLAQPDHRATEVARQRAKRQALDCGTVCEGNAPTQEDLS
jgi:hypothetical protein